MVVCGSVVGLGMNLMGSRGSPWVRWSWLVVGGVVVARCGSVGFDGLAGLDSMVAGLASWLLGWFSWWVCGLVELKGYGSWVLRKSLKTEGYGS